MRAPMPSLSVALFQAENSTLLLLHISSTYRCNHQGVSYTLRCQEMPECMIGLHRNGKATVPDHSATAGISLVGADDGKGGDECV